MPPNRLTIRKEYRDGQVLTEAILDNMLADITSYNNATNINNLNQLLLDGWGTTNSIDNDGAQNKVNTLFEKQRATQTYTAAVIDMAAAPDADFVDVDAVNASFTFTPETAGNYRAYAAFTVRLQSTAGTAPVFFGYYRLRDITTPVNGTPESIGWNIAAVGGVQVEYTVPVLLTTVFNLTAVATTIRLQKRNVTTTNIGTHQVYVNAIGPTGLVLAVEKI